MTGDGFAVLENMAVTINDFQLCHRILLCQRRFASQRFEAFVKSRANSGGQCSSLAPKVAHRCIVIVNTSEFADSIRL
jgi:hypothetical protein